ncbi:MAG TPA: Ig-like domain-containing protein [Gemmatimonadaceae bacterium]|nr:Ig-like domain-containing protein [Gemmatimonadaceae bacterium]
MRKTLFLCAVVMLSACSKGGDPIEPLVATTLTVSTTPTTITVNGTAQASAIVKDQNGNPLTGQTIAWTSLNPTIASVDGTTGVVRGLAAGNAIIQGKTGNVTGTGTVTVTGLVASCSSGPTVLNLAVGEVKVLSATESKGCIKISSTGLPSQYLVIGANANSIPEQSAVYTLKSDEGETVPNNTLLANPVRIAAALQVSSLPPSITLQDNFEMKLRMAERRELSLPDAQEAYRARGSGPSTIRKSVSVAIPNIGDKTVFKVPGTGSDPCTGFINVTATAQYISNKAIIYLDDAAPAGGFTAQDYQDIGSEFDNLIYPTDVSYFGTPLDYDNNSRVIILYTVQVNKLTASGSPNGFVGGFFFVGDFFEPTGANSCAQSNKAEIFYVLTPDPTGSIVPNAGGTGNVRSTSQVRQGTRGTIAHEFQHMINASERIRSPILQPLEDTWLDEALSHFAEDANGRALKQLSETANASFATLFSSVNDYSAFFYQNFARFRSWMLSPGSTSPISKEAASSLGIRGAAWALLRYTADQYAPGGDIKAFTRALAGGPNIGVNNLTLRAGSVPFDSLVAGWMVANYADDAGIAGLNPKYTYKSFDMRSNMAAQPISSNQQYPLAITEIAGTGFISTNQTANSGTGDYFRFSRVASGPARTFRFLNADGATTASFTGATLYILRTQ